MVRDVFLLSLAQIDQSTELIEFTLASFVRYVKVELQDPTYGARYREVFSALKERLSNASFDSACAQSSSKDANMGSADTTRDSKGASFKSIVDSVSKLARKHPDQNVDSGDRTRSKQRRVKTVWDILVQQDRFITGIMDIQLKSRHARGKRDAKEMHLKELLRAEGFDRYRGIHPVPLPSKPIFLVNGVNPQSAKVFKSNLYPALLEFHVDSCIQNEPSKDIGSQNASSPVALTSYKVIVKTGDDLRQDQLVIMMIQLMDGLLKRGTLDLCLRPYSIIAMSPSSGLVEFVDNSMPISQVLASHGNSVMQFFRTHAPKRGAKYDVQPEVISTYVRSCAGYCVITYILGVGDRHLDNIMLQPSGHFFHIDFGFIFGRDPKPLPPAFRLTREVRLHHS